mmetsp:Transcript_29724/g.72336  ORF Transcript_29724/g.72336 Transcript_29724/m.72336 type:complete len:353 (+) Transcript_29724:2-1060(+)
MWEDEDDIPGTPLWMAPEVMMRKPFTDKIDVYAFGLILWEIWTRGVLFEAYDDFKPFIAAVTQRHERPRIPADVRDSVAGIMRDCWAPDPAKRPSFADVLPRLDWAIIDHTVRRDDGKAFWRRHFLDGTNQLLESVKWREFVKVLGKETGHSLVNIVALGAYFTQDPPPGGVSQDKLVTMRRFNDAITWFGPFYSPTEGGAILDWMKLLASKPWFHGDVSREVAERRLLHREEGTFLVRLSVNKPDHPFTVSVLRPTPSGVGNAPQHKRIKHVYGSNEWYAPVGGRTQCFASLLDMVADEECALRHPCPKEESVNPYISTYLEASDAMGPPGGLPPTMGDAINGGGGGGGGS